MNTKILTHSVELSQAEVYNRILAMEVFHSNHVEIPCPTAPLHKPQLRPTPRSAALSTGFAEVAKRIHKSSKRSTYKQLYIKENCTRNVKLSLCIWPAHVAAARLVQKRKYDRITATLRYVNTYTCTSCVPSSRSVYGAAPFYLMHGNVSCCSLHLSS